MHFSQHLDVEMTGLSGKSVMLIINAGTLYSISFLSFTICLMCNNGLTYQVNIGIRVYSKITTNLEKKPTSSEMITD